MAVGTRTNEWTAPGVINTRIMAESSASISGDGERRVVIAVPEGGAGPTNVREDADAPSPAPPAQLLRQSTQLDRTESFKAVAIDDVEGAVHSFIASEQTHKLRACSSLCPPYLLNCAPSCRLVVGRLLAAWL